MDSDNGHPYEENEDHWAAAEVYNSSPAPAPASAPVDLFVGAWAQAPRPGGYPPSIVFAETQQHTTAYPDPDVPDQTRLSLSMVTLPEPRPWDDSQHPSQESIGRTIYAHTGSTGARTQSSDGTPQGILGRFNSWSSTNSTHSGRTVAASRSLGSAPSSVSTSFADFQDAVPYMVREEVYWSPLLSPTPAFESFYTMSNFRQVNLATVLIGSTGLGSTDVEQDPPWNVYFSSISWRREDRIAWFELLFRRSWLRATGAQTGGEGRLHPGTEGDAGTSESVNTEHDAVTSE